MSEESPSAFEEHSQGLDPSNRSAYPPAYPPTPTNPDRTSFRPHARATGGTTSSGNEKSLVLYTGPRGGSIGRAESLRKRPSESGLSKRRKEESEESESGENSDEWVTGRFKRLNLGGEEPRFSRK